VLQCVVARYSVLQRGPECNVRLRSFLLAVSRGLQCVAVCCSVFLCVAVCCSVLWCVYSHSCWLFGVRVAWFVCMRTCVLFECEHTCIHVQICVCMCMYVHTCMYVSIYQRMH